MALRRTQRRLNRLQGGQGSGRSRYQVVESTAVTQRLDCDGSSCSSSAECRKERLVAVAATRRWDE